MPGHGFSVNQHVCITCGDDSRTVTFSGAGYGITDPGDGNTIDRGCRRALDDFPSMVGGIAHNDNWS